MMKRQAIPINRMDMITMWMRLAILFLENLIYFMVEQASQLVLEYIKSNGTMRKNRV